MCVCMCVVHNCKADCSKFLSIIHPTLAKYFIHHILQHCTSSQNCACTNEHVLIEMISLTVIACLEV